MGKGAPIGATRINANGYSYTKTTQGWRLTHHMIAEDTIRRPIKYGEERVIFKDGNRTNLEPENIAVVPAKNGKQQQIEKLKARVDETLMQLTLYGIEGKVTYSQRAR